MEVLDRADPIKARERRRAEQLARDAATVSFQDCAEKLIRSKLDGWTDPKQPAQWRASLRDHVYPRIGKVPVNEITTGHVTSVLESIWSTRYVTAGRVRSRIEAVLDYAKTHGWRTGENPARWEGHLENTFATKPRGQVKHHPALDWRRIPELVRVLGDHPGAAALALRFALLTAVRTTPVLGARWSEIDLEKAVWTVPDGREKSGRELRVPLSESALGILRQARKLGLSDHVFPGNGASGRLAGTALRKLLKHLGYVGITVHGTCRAGLSTWAAETGHQSDIVEAALSHVISNRTRAAYQRGDLFERRRRLMDAWSRFCTSPEAASDVIELRRHG
jgi:integrase